MRNINKSALLILIIGIIFLSLTGCLSSYNSQEEITDFEETNDLLTPPPVSSVYKSSEHIPLIQDEVPILNDYFTSVIEPEPPKEEVVAAKPKEEKKEPKPASKPEPPKEPEKPTEPEPPVTPDPPVEPAPPVEPKPPVEPAPQPPTEPEPVYEPIVNTNSALYTYNGMMKDISLLKERYGDLIESQIIGTSVLGYSIPVVRLGSSQAPKKVLISGAIHAREYMATQLIMKQIEYYLESYSTLTYNNKSVEQVLSQTAIYFVPMVNPDGVTLAQKGLSFIEDEQLKATLLAMNNGSDNFSQWKANIKGVDLNRNFDVDWSKSPVVNPGPQFHRGSAPESEPETKALTNYIRNSNFDSYIDYHSKGSIIFWYYNQAGSQYNRDLSIASGLSSITGYSLVSASDPYTAYGCANDWFITAFKKPAFTMEIGSKYSTHPLKISEFNNIFSRNKDIPLALTQFIE